MLETEGWFRQSPEQLTRSRGRCVIAALARREDTGAVRTAPVVSQRGLPPR